MCFYNAAEDLYEVIDFAKQKGIGEPDPTQTKE